VTSRALAPVPAVPKGGGPFPPTAGPMSRFDTASPPRRRGSRRARHRRQATPPIPVLAVVGVIVVIVVLITVTRVVAGPAAAGGAPATTPTTVAPAARTGALANGSFQDAGAPLAGWTPDGAGAAAVQPGWRSSRAARVWPLRAASAGDGMDARWPGIATRLGGGYERGTVVTASVRVRAPVAGATARIALVERTAGQEPTGDAVAVPLDGTGWRHLSVRHTVAAGDAELELRLLTDAAARAAVIVLDAATVTRDE